jgi:hypothetical protein
MTSTTPTPTTCQVCGREIKLKARGYLAGTIADHGYKRPGWGYNSGGCPGERCVPYEVGHEALRGWIKTLKAEYRRTNEELEKTMTGDCRVFEQKYDPASRRWVPVEVPRDHFSWERHRRSQEWSLKKMTERLNAEIEAQTDRLHSWPSARREAGWD